MDSSNWTYRIEGAQHFVFDYLSPTGRPADHDALRNTVLRLASVPVETETSIIRETEPPPSDLLCFTRAVFLSDERLSEHIDPGTIVDISAQFLQQLASDAEPRRPVRRREKTKLDISATKRHAMVFRDHIKRYGEQHSLCVEVKPKSAPRMRSRLTPMEVVSTINPFVQSAYAIKHNEAADGGGYDPADLLSGDKDRTWIALNILQETNAHILRIYEAGELVVADDLHGAKYTDPDEAYQSQLCTEMISVVREVLTANSDVLAALQRIQDRDYLGASGAELVYDRLVALTGSEKTARQDIWAAYFNHPADAHNWERAKARLAYSSAIVAVAAHNEENYNDATRFVQASLTSECAAAALADYMVAGVAKDCSMMISISRGEETSSADPTVLVGGREYHYHLSIVDLEPKPFDKIRYWSNRQDKYVERMKLANDLV